MRGLEEIKVGGKKRTFREKRNLIEVQIDNKKGETYGINE